MNLNTNFTNEEKTDVNFSLTFCHTQRFFSFDDLKIRYVNYEISKRDKYYYMSIFSEYRYYPLEIIVSNIRFSLYLIDTDFNAYYKSSKLC